MNILTGFRTSNLTTKLRVEAANASYVVMVDLARFLVSRECSISIENPKNSLFWKCTFIVNFLQSLPTYHICEFQHCMHGGKRNKFTHWVSFNPRNPTVDLFQSLNLLCDNSHAHASWAPYADDLAGAFFQLAVKQPIQNSYAKELHASFAHRVHFPH